MLLRQAVERESNMQVKELADLSDNLIRFEKVVNGCYHKYECTEFELDFAVSQNFQDQDCIKCPSCLTEDHLHDRGSLQGVDGP